MSVALHTLGVAELGRMLDAGEASSVEVTTHLLARVSKHQQLGAFLCVDAEEIVQLAPHRAALVARQIEPRQQGNAIHVLGCQRHGRR